MRPELIDAAARIWSGLSKSQRRDLAPRMVDALIRAWRTYQRRIREEEKDRR